MTRLEKRVFLGLTRYPELSDNGVGKRIGVSRQSVSKMRKRFESERLLVQAQIPDVLKMGAEIVSVSWFEFAPGASQATRKKAMDWSLRELPVVFQAAGSHGGMMMHLERNFEDLQRHRHGLARFFSDKGLLKGEPRIVNFSAGDTILVRDFNFAPAVKRVLGMDSEKSR